MAVGITLIAVILLVVVVWILIEVKRMRHKIFAIFLIFMILFTYFSFSASIAGKNVDFSTPDGWMQAGGLYVSWLGATFSRIVSVTTYAIGLNWSAYNSTNQTTTPPPQNITNQTNTSTNSTIQDIWNKLK